MGFGIRTDNLSYRQNMYKNILREENIPDRQCSDYLSGKIQKGNAYES